MFLLVNDVLTREECEELKRTELKRYDLSEAMKFDMGEPANDIQKIIMEKTDKLLELYVEYFNLEGFTPASTGYEGAKVKRYSTGDEFSWHSDGVDPRSCRRQLGFLWYLGGEYTGGKTEYMNGLVVDGKEGDVLIFPPFWLYPHRGQPVVGEKWIMTNYLSI